MEDRAMEMYLVVRTSITTSDGLTLLVLCKEDSHTEYHWRVWRQVQDGYYSLTMFTWEDAQDEVRSRGGDSLVAAVPVDREYLDKKVGSVSKAKDAAPLYIYVVSRPDGRRHSMYYSCAVVAATENDARQIHPDWYNDYPNRVWVSGWVPMSDIHLLKVRRIGVADEGMVAGTVLVSDYDPLSTLTYHRTPPGMVELSLDSPYYYATVTITLTQQAAR